MPKKCGLGFSCAVMMQHPALEAKDCENYSTCGAGFEYSEDERIELVQVREQQQERIRITRKQAALIMLMNRGNPQSLESFGIPDLVNEIESLFEEMKAQLIEFEDIYIAPESVEAHQYAVKRPSGVYSYNKFTSKEAIFEPSERTEKVKVLHLSHDDDPRNIEGRLGIERRNQLTQLKTKLREIKARLSDAQSLLE